MICNKDFTNFIDEKYAKVHYVLSKFNIYPNASYIPANVKTALAETVNAQLKNPAAHDQKKETRNVH